MRHYPEQQVPMLTLLLIVIGGVASALISLPLRYMHTTVEMVQKKMMLKNVINLIYQTLLNMKNNDNFSYFK